MCTIPVCHSVWKEKEDAQDFTFWAHFLSRSSTGTLGDWVCVMFQWYKCMFWGSLPLSKLLLMWFHSLHCLMWLFTASASLSTALSQSPWELGSAGVTCVYQWGSAPEEHRLQRPWEEGSAHWVWNHASLDAEGLGWCQVKQNGLWKHHCLRRFQEGVWSAGKARAWAPAPSLAMLPLVSLSHRLCCPAGREARWSLQFFSPLETCESKGALVRKLISVCLCNIYFIFTIYIIGWIIFVIILFWIITENI